MAGALQVLLVLEGLEGRHRVLRRLLPRFRGQRLDFLRYCLAKQTLRFCWNRQAEGILGSRLALPGPE